MIMTIMIMTIMIITIIMIINNTSSGSNNSNDNNSNSNNDNNNNNLNQIRYTTHHPVTATSPSDLMHLELLAKWPQRLQLQRAERSGGGADEDAPELGAGEALLGRWPWEGTREIYPLAKCYITMENHHFMMGKSTN